jgi:Fur family transcriptional regulator, ferric uptake regulator
LKTTSEILERHGLRKTDARMAILQAFKKSKTALSHGDIESLLKTNFDRVTLYRTLTSFLEKGIIHKVLDDSEAAKYAYCVDDCNEHHHHDEHVHFKCTKCGLSECLQEIHIPNISLPKGYKFIESNILVEGVCAKCN